MFESRMNHRERMENSIGDGPLDRIPVALWRHFPVDDQNPERLAAATINYQRIYDFDFVKVTPASSYCLKDWGVADEWRGDTEGTRDYTKRVIREPEDWAELAVLDPYKGYLANQLECLRIITTELGSQVPVIQTIFSPLSQAKNLIGKETLLSHLRTHPEAVIAGLKIITEGTQLFVEAAIQTGIAGIFYAVQHAQYHLMSAEEYQIFGRLNDLEILKVASDLWLNVLHLHGENVMFEFLADYPVAVINWHDRDTEPDLARGAQRFPGAVCGGLQREQTMVFGDPEKVISEARDAFHVTGGRRFILGTGCVVPITAPHGNLLAARNCVENLK